MDITVITNGVYVYIYICLYEMYASSNNISVWRKYVSVQKHLFLAHMADHR